MKRRKFYLASFLCVLLCLPLAVHADGIEYSIDIEGVNDSTVAKTLRAVSQLIALKKRPPSSLSALHFRAEADLKDFKRILHAFGYYEATFSVEFEEKFQSIDVIIHVDPGPVYTIGEVTIELYSEDPRNPISCKKTSAKSLGLRPGDHAISHNIVHAELTLLERLANYSYPLAKVEKRDVIADGDTKEVAVTLVVDAGPFCHFGPVCTEGLASVSPRLIDKKLDWSEGSPYKSTQISSTQCGLIDTGLFTSVLISHEKSLDESGRLPIKIEVTESKHRSVNIGTSYQTFFGPGVTFGWENRNINGMGRKLSIKGDITKRSHSGIASLFIPDFYVREQNYVWQAQAMHESITAYSQRTYNVLTRIERQFGRRFSSSAGLKLERLYVTNSVKNGRFLLFEVPLYSRWSSANSLLDPTKGATLDWRINPSVNIDNINTYYLEQELRLSHYYPLVKSRALVIAQKVTLGSIISPKLRVVPVSKRFLGGSEEELRGYKYKTVSALNKDNKPIGGRSAIYYTLETRFRFTQTLGLVPFFDLGNVFATQFPTGKGKWLKSVGLGLRYFSFIGPLRFDIGFPLNRRKGLDPVYRILVSIGQSF